jgi:hypothetical protein
MKVANFSRNILLELVSANKGNVLLYLYNGE